MYVLFLSFTYPNALSLDIFVQVNYLPLNMTSTTETKYLKDADPAAALTRGAKKEIAYLRKFGQPLHPFQRLRREIYNYQKQSHLDYLDSLDKYLRITPYLVP